MAPSVAVLMGFDCNLEILFRETQRLEEGRLILYMVARMGKNNRRTTRWIFRYQFKKFLNGFFDPSRFCAKS